MNASVFSAGRKGVGFREAASELGTGVTETGSGSALTVGMGFETTGAGLGLKTDVTGDGLGSSLGFGRLESTRKEKNSDGKPPVMMCNTPCRSEGPLSYLPQRRKRLPQGRL